MRGFGLVYRTVVPVNSTQGQIPRCIEGCSLPSATPYEESKRRDPFKGRLLRRWRTRKHLEIANNCMSCNY